MFFLTDIVLCPIQIQLKLFIFFEFVIKKVKSQVIKAAKDQDTWKTSFVVLNISPQKARSGYTIEVND